MLYIYLHDSLSALILHYILLCHYGVLSLSGLNYFNDISCLATYNYFLPKTADILTD